MPIRGLPNGVRHTRPQTGRDRPEQVVAINRNSWSRSSGARTQRTKLRKGSVPKRGTARITADDPAGGEAEPESLSSNLSRCFTDVTEAVRRASERRIRFLRGTLYS